MVDLFVLDGMVTMSISHPYYSNSYKVMISNVNLVKDNNCRESDLLTNDLVKYFGFG